MNDWWYLFSIWSGAKSLFKCDQRTINESIISFKISKRNDNRFVIETKKIIHTFYWSWSTALYWLRVSICLRWENVSIMRNVEFLKPLQDRMLLLDKMWNIWRTCKSDRKLYQTLQYPMLPEKIKELASIRIQGLGCLEF